MRPRPRLSVWVPILILPHPKEHVPTIDQTIGETIGVVRDDHFAIGIQALNIKTTGGARGTDAGSAGR